MLLMLPSRTIFYRSYQKVKGFSNKKGLLYNHQNGLALTATNVNRSSSSTSQHQWTQSYIHEASSVKLKGITVGKLFQEQVEKTPDKEAFIFYTEKIRKTFSQFLEECDQLAAGFYCLGVQRGDRLGIWGPNTYEWLLTKFAAFRSGIILVNINPAYKKNELEYAINKVELKAIMIAESLPKQDFHDHIFQLAPELETATPGDLNAKNVPSLKTVILMGETRKPGTFLFNDVVQAGTTKARQYILDIQNKIQFDDPVNIQFTSGTTGSSKGATLSHYNIINNSYFVGLRLAYDKTETRICLPVPLYHCFGSVLGSLMMLTHGSTCVFPSKVFDPRTVLKAVQAEKCTSLYGVPTMFIDMLNEADNNQYDLTSLHTGIMAGSPCPVVTMNNVVTKLHMPKVVVCYGSTETSPVTFQGRMDDSVETRCTTIGQPSCHNEVKVVNENGEIVPLGEPGELLTRGYTTMLGYWNDPQKTAEVISSDKWYRTGDMVILDERGYGIIIGRYKDMIIRGGENIYPTEIEHLLYKHPKVRDIQVVGVPDERMGEEICACVQLHDGMECSEQELKDYCLQNLSKYKQPRYVLFMDSYPLTATGKIQKYKIREMAKLILKLDTDTF